MRKIHLLVGSVLTTLCLMLASPGVSAKTVPPPDPPPPPPAPTVVADWELNEAPGATVMADSSGNAHDGAISPDAAAAGLTMNAWPKPKVGEIVGSAYQWSLRCPACLPAALPRVVQVPDSPDLDIPDPAVPYTIEFRFNTHKGYGNMMQKGQGTTVGGQIKIENPNGFTSCVFLGAGGAYVSVRGTTPLNDGVWHTLRCIHTATYVSQEQLQADGTWLQVGRKNVRTGAIDNTKPFVIGGKPSCNQITVTCDYYSGYMDYVKIIRN